MITEVPWLWQKQQWNQEWHAKTSRLGSLQTRLRELMGQESKLTRQLYETARRDPQRVVFAEGIHPTMLKAAVEAKAEGICHPILLGNDERIEKLAKRTGSELGRN